MKRYVKHIVIPIVLIVMALLLKTVVERYYVAQDNINKEKTMYIKEQLDVFYLPLKQTLHQSKVSWSDYKKQYGNENVYEQINKGIDNPHTRKWQHYMLKVFRPLHKELAKILKRRDLLIKNTQLREKLDLLQTHINQYQIIFAQWDNKNRSENIAILHFPEKLEEELNTEIKTLLQKRDSL